MGRLAGRGGLRHQLRRATTCAQTCAAYERSAASLEELLHTVAQSTCPPAPERAAQTCALASASCAPPGRAEACPILAVRGLASCRRPRRTPKKSGALAGADADARQPEGAAARPRQVGKPERRQPLPRDPGGLPGLRLRSGGGVRCRTPVKWYVIIHSCSRALRSTRSTPTTTGDMTHGVKKQYCYRPARPPARLRTRQLARLGADYLGCYGLRRQLLLRQPAGYECTRCVAPSSVSFAKAWTRARH